MGDHLARAGARQPLEMMKEIHFPHSLGLLYAAFTAYTGFQVNSGEYKMMGLAPYGEPRYVQKILDHLIDVKSDGSFQLDQSYFNYCTGLSMTSARFHALFGGEPRDENEPADATRDGSRSLDPGRDGRGRAAAHSLDRRQRPARKNLCLAGGVALNCVANGKIVRDGKFEGIWVQPAAGDAGGALGAALAAYHLYLNKPRLQLKTLDAMEGCYLGPGFHASRDRAPARRMRRGVRGDRRSRADRGDGRRADRGKGGRLVPGADGIRPARARQPLDPRRPAQPDMQKTLNLRVKYRESFRPFAPSVLREDVADWFDLDGDSPYMLVVADVAEKRRTPLEPGGRRRVFGTDKVNATRSEIPAVTHVDYSARLQTVHRETNPRYHALIVGL